MSKAIFQGNPPDPFPDPVHAGQEIEFVGVMFAQILLLLVLIILLIYFTKKSRKYVSIVVIYLLSLVIGFICLIECLIPFFPYFQLFFILFQTSLFIQSGLDYYTISKKKRGIL